MTTDTIINQKAHQNAWVVFTGETDWPWLRWLRAGFRHCFIIVNDGERWLSLDPLLNHTELQIYHHLPADFDLPEWLRSRGLRVMPALVDRRNRRPAPMMLFTCVEAVKRVIGLHSRMILTPWQLYRHLEKKHNVNGGLAWAA